MRRLQLVYLVALLTVSLGTASAGEPAPLPETLDPGPVTPFTQRDADYQRAMNKLAQALQLLSRAKKELAASEAEWQLPGFNYDLVYRDISTIEASLRPIFEPQREVLETETMVMDGYYFKKPEAHISSGPMALPTDDNE